MPVDFRILPLSVLAKNASEPRAVPNRKRARPEEEDPWETKGGGSSPAPAILDFRTPASELAAHAALRTSEVLAAALPSDLEAFESVGFLAACHSHPWDKTIVFKEDSHKYYCTWLGPESGPESVFTSTDTTSVSGLVHGFFPEFNADAVLRNIKRSRAYGVGHKYFGSSDEAIKAGWAENGRLASAQGTKFHALVEYFYNGFNLAPYAHFRVVRQFLRFHAEHVQRARLVPFRTEMRLRSGNELRLTGTIDALFVDEFHPEPHATNGTLYLYMKDWKFSKKIEVHNKYETGLRACSKLPNCNYYHYALQQNLYKWLLETYYTHFQFRGATYSNVRVANMQLVVCHDSRDEYELVDVPELQSVVEAMLEERRELLAAARGSDSDGQLNPGDLI